jgi:hypothetical protein
LEQVDGTSASSPIVAAMVALWNGYRLNNKKSTLGFINPALYKAAEARQDRVQADRQRQQQVLGELLRSADGFEANPKGWDSVTGLGVARFPSLLNYFASLQVSLFEIESSQIASKRGKRHRSMDEQPTVAVVRCESD